MIGLIHHSLKVMVLELFGLELWETVLRENNIDIDIEFAALEYYPDGPLVALVVSLSKNLGKSRNWLSPHLPIIILSVVRVWCIVEEEAKYQFFKN